MVSIVHHTRRLEVPSQQSLGRIHYIHNVDELTGIKVIK
jgi:hypothetical protein